MNSSIVILLVLSLITVSIVTLKAWRKNIENTIRLELNEQKMVEISRLKARLKKKQSETVVKIKEKIKYVDRIIKQNPTDCVVPSYSVELLEEAKLSYSVPISALSANSG